MKKTPFLGHFIPFLPKYGLTIFFKKSGSVSFRYEKNLYVTTLRKQVSNVCTYIRAYEWIKVRTSLYVSHYAQAGSRSAVFINLKHTLPLAEAVSTKRAIFHAARFRWLPNVVFKYSAMLHFLAYCVAFHNIPILLQSKNLC